MTSGFDRGGWSRRSFQKLIADGFDLLPYRTGHTCKRLCWEVREHRADLDGRQVVYRLADHGVGLLGGKLELRDGRPPVGRRSHQTRVVASRRDLPATEVAYRRFERWRQETFFPYLRVAADESAPAAGPAPAATAVSACLRVPLRPPL